MSGGESNLRMLCSHGIHLRDLWACGGWVGCAVHRFASASSMGAQSFCGQSHGQSRATNFYVSTCLLLLSLLFLLLIVIFVVLTFVSVKVIFQSSPGVGRPVAMVPQLSGFLVGQMVGELGPAGGVGGGSDWGATADSDKGTNGYLVALVVRVWGEMARAQL